MSNMVEIYRKVIMEAENIGEIIVNNNGFQATALLMGLSGYSLRDLKGKFNFGKFIEKFKKEFRNGTDTEKKNKILSDCFIELEDYIKNNTNFDDNVFEKITDVLINGLKEEDILTREYIGTLKQLTWLELDVFMQIANIEKFKTNYSSSTYEILVREVARVLKLEGCQYPQELLIRSIYKLENLLLITKPVLGSKEILLKSAFGVELNNRLIGV